MKLQINKQIQSKHEKKTTTTKTNKQQKRKLHKNAKMFLCNLRFYGTGHDHQKICFYHLMIENNHQKIK